MGLGRPLLTHSGRGPSRDAGGHGNTAKMQSQLFQQVIIRPQLGVWVSHTHWLLHWWCLTGGGCLGHRGSLGFSPFISGRVVMQGGGGWGQGEEGQPGSQPHVLFTKRLKQRHSNRFKFLVNWTGPGCFSQTGILMSLSSYIGRLESPFSPLLEVVHLLYHILQIKL